MGSYLLMRVHMMHQCFQRTQGCQWWWWGLLQPKTWRFQGAHLNLRGQGTPAQGQQDCWCSKHSWYLKHEHQEWVELQITLLGVTSFFPTKVALSVYMITKELITHRMPANTNNQGRPTSVAFSTEFLLARYSHCSKDRRTWELAI